MSPDSELTELGDEELRERLRGVRREEADVSYERRMLHGKIDVLRSEVRQRMNQGAGGQGADSEALESLLGRLTDVLVHKGPPPIEAELHELGLEDEDETAPAPQVPPAEELPAFDTLSDDDLGALVRALVHREREVSARRRELHGTLDRLKSEHVARLQRRYASEAGDE